MNKKNLKKILIDSVDNTKCNVMVEDIISKSTFDYKPSHLIEKIKKLRFNSTLSKVFNSFLMLILLALGIKMIIYFGNDGGLYNGGIDAHVMNDDINKYFSKNAIMANKLPIAYYLLNSGTELFLYCGDDIENNENVYLYILKYDNLNISNFQIEVEYKNLDLIEGINYGIFGSVPKDKESINFKITLNDIKYEYSFTNNY